MRSYRLKIVAEAADRHPITVGNMIRDGKIMAEKRIGRAVYYLSYGEVVRAFGKNVADECEVKSQFIAKKKLLRPAFNAGCKYQDALMNHSADADALLKKALAAFRSASVSADAGNLVEILADLLDEFAYKVTSKKVYFDLLGFIQEKKRNADDF